MVEPSGKSIDLGTLGGRDTEVVALNDQGIAIGYSELKKKGNASFIWDKTNGMRDLTKLTSSSHNFKNWNVLDINNRNIMLGVGIYKKNDQYFLLVPKDNK